MRCLLVAGASTRVQLGLRSPNTLNTAHSPCPSTLPAHPSTPLCHTPLLAQVDLGSARSSVEAERAARQDATAAVAKLESVIATVRQEMIEAQEASNQVCGWGWLGAGVGWLAVAVSGMFHRRCGAVDSRSQALGHSAPPPALHQGMPSVQHPCCRSGPLLFSPSSHVLPLPRASLPSCRPRCSSTPSARPA